MVAKLIYDISAYWVSGICTEEQDYKVGTPFTGVPIIGYLKETRGGFFYSPEENKVFVSTNATFLEKDYMREFKPRSKIVFDEFLASSTSMPSTVVVDKNIAPSISDRQMNIIIMIDYLGVVEELYDNLITI